MESFKDYLEGSQGRSDHTVERGLLEDMFGDVQGNTVRLILADFYEDSGNSFLAERLRKPPGPDPDVLSWGQWSSVNVYNPRWLGDPSAIGIASLQKDIRYVFTENGREERPLDPWPSLPPKSWVKVLYSRARYMPSARRLGDNWVHPEAVAASGARHPGGTVAMTVRGGRLDEVQVEINAVPIDALRAMVFGIRLNLPHVVHGYWG